MGTWCPRDRLWVGVPPRRECPVRGHGLVDTDGGCWTCRDWPHGKLRHERVNGVGCWVETNTRERRIAEPERQRLLEAVLGAGWRGETSTRTDAEREAHRQAVLAQADGLTAEPTKNRLGLTEVDWASLLARAETKA